MASIEITTNVGCTLACKFCPQDKISKLYKNSSDRMMSLENYQLILSKIPKNVRIDFSGYSEPFLNPLAIDFIEYTANNGYQQSIYSTLTGISLENANKLFDLLESRKINKFIIHLPDNHNNMPGFKLHKEYYDCLKILLESEFVSCMTMSRTNDIPLDIFSYVKNNCSKKSLQKLPKSTRKNGFVGWRRADSLDTSSISKELLLPIVRWNLPISCASSPFYNSNVVMPNGNVHLCCMDYAGKHILGNLLTDSYLSLFQSKEMSNVISINMQNQFSDNTICRKCEDVTLHEYNYNSHGWSSFRPGHMINYFEKFNINESNKKSLITIIRSFLIIKNEFKNIFKDK
jgi:radical SAM protein with 4Fe4S-binding SPASM domain